MRSAESIKTKIVRVMASYKETNERLLSTGGGLKGLAYTTFQEFVINNICKYYLDLNPVLKNRPNVRAWHSNDAKRRNNKIVSIEETSAHSNDVQTILLSSDDEEVSGSENTMTNASCIEINDEYEEEDNFVDLEKTTNTSSSSLPHTSDDSTHNTSDDTDSTNDVKGIGTITRKRMTPSEAKKSQKLLSSKRNKSFIKKKGKNKSSIVRTNRQEDRDLVVETRNAKMKFEMKRHDELKSIEAEKLKIEKERLQMDLDNSTFKQEHISAQTKLENNKILLLRLEIFKERQRIRKENPEFTEEYLDEKFPYPN